MRLGLIWFARASKWHANSQSRISPDELGSPAPSVASLLEIDDMQLLPRNFYWIFFGKHYWRGSLKSQWTVKWGEIYWLNCWATKTKSRVLTTPSPLGSGAAVPSPLAT